MVSLINKSENSKVELGDIRRNIVLKEADFICNEMYINELRLPYVLVVSQSCDLERHYEDISSLTDNQLLGVIVVPLYPLSIFMLGEHLKGLSKTAQQHGQKLIDRYRKEEHPRYHIIDIDNNKRLNHNLPDSFVIDFRHHITVSYDLIFSAKCTESINLIYREEISQRLFYYLSRIGLPNI